MVDSILCKESNKCLFYNTFRHTIQSATKNKLCYLYSLDIRKTENKNLLLMNIEEDAKLWNIIRDYKNNILYSGNRKRKQNDCSIGYKIGGIDMVTTGYSSAYGNRIHKSLICGYCGKSLGSYDWEDGKEYSDIEGWVYCPYCGEELEPDMNMN